MIGPSGWIDHECASSSRQLGQLNSGGTCGSCICCNSPCSTGDRNPGFTLYQPRFLDTWTLLSFIGAATERIRLFPDVAALPLRPPAMLAKAAASLDLLTQGHVELGLGAGAFWEPIAAMGGPHRSKRKSVAVLSEACVSARPSAIASTNWAYVTPGAAPCAVPSPGRP